MIDWTPISKWNENISDEVEVLIAIPCCENKGDFNYLEVRWFKNDKVFCDQTGDLHYKTSEVHSFTIINRPTILESKNLETVLDIHVDSYSQFLRKSEVPLYGIANDTGLEVEDFVKAFTFFILMPKVGFERGVAPGLPPMDITFKGYYAWSDIAREVVEQIEQKDRFLRAVFHHLSLTLEDSPVENYRAS